MDLRLVRKFDEISIGLLDYRYRQGNFTGGFISLNRL